MAKDGLDFEYAIKGTYEGLWRAIQGRDTWSIRDAGRVMQEHLNELADWIEGGRISTGSVEKSGSTED